ncbi:MAG TPA: PDZ domain-containing protein [Tepidisphaeraceae bacterium]|nr:PDZ domain-containing protein [Tepidisphaeraceae bacterium]
MKYPPITAVLPRLLGVFAVFFGMTSHGRAADSATAAVAEFPVQYWGEPIAIPVTWAGKPGCFLFDTGCARNILDTTAFPKLIPTGIDAHFITPAGKQKVVMFNPPNLHVGPFSLADSGMVTRVDLADIRAYTGLPVIGILGRTAMSDSVVQLDFDHHVLRVLSPSQSAATDWGQAYPLHPDPVRGLLVRIPLNGVARDMLVDTGYSGSVALPTDAFNALAKQSDQPAIPVSALTYGGYVPLRGMRLPITDIGTLRYHDLIIYETKSAPAIGLDFLERHLTTFDFPHDRLYLNPAHSFAHQSQSDMSGLHARLYNGQTIAETIDPHSSAAQAGLHPGDVITAINGQPASGFTMPALRALTESGDGKPITITFRRGDLQRTVLLHLHRSI